ncbi:YheC/YheD family protein [Bacillus horti]|uniref:YheC/YheD family endospore coat-associated protein n=1 Tax=Caldalkalibacillus horti TaxID=77523 RepID=UPI0031D08350
MKVYYHPKQNAWFIKKHQRSKEESTYSWGANHAPIQKLFVPKLPDSQPSFSINTVKSRESRKKGYLVPLIGIMAAKGNNAPFTGNRRNFIDLIGTGKRNGAILYVFTPDQIDWENEQIRGWFYNFSVKGWQEALFPFPNVIYNRISTREQESSSDAQQAISRFQAYGKRLTLFNPHFFNKQDTFQLLKSSRELSSFLPDTQILQTKQDLVQMLRKHQTIYLKPTKGKAGKGILRIIIQPNERNFLFTSQLSNQIISMTVTSVEKLWRLYQKYRISSPYIAQQGIELETIQDQPFDFRVLVQKNKTGQWEVTGVGTRVAGKNRITTHVPQGGRIENSNSVLEALYPNQAPLILANIHQLALAIAKILEANYHVLGEMSMDIGLDKKKRLWFFEANSKPMKFDEPTIRTKSLNNLIDYSKHLTFNHS